MAYVQPGWVLQQQQVQQSSPSRATLKRTRSASPISNKKRVPSSYQPALYSSVPSRLIPDPTANLSRDSDWVTRTEDLQLATPPGGGSPLYDGEGYGAEEMAEEVYSQEMMDAEPTHVEQPSFVHPDHQTSYFPSHPHPSLPVSLPSTPLARDSPFAPQTPTPPIHPPHCAPSLYANLAGSPVARSLSSDSAMSESQSDVRMQATPPKKTGGWRVAMGYRADCEKCINRVPGHYSHIIH